MTIRILTTALAIAAFAGLAHAKGHDQGSSAEPGDNVQEETAGPAKCVVSTLVGGQGSNPTCDD